MKRSLIAWDETELPRSVLDARLQRARERAAERGAEALALYTDVWRSNPARALVNFMPYWGRSLLVVPVDGRTVLLCGNSPRAYPWMRTVTHVEELRACQDLAGGLVALATELGWKTVAVSDLGELPYGIYRKLMDAAVELVDLPWESISGNPDAAELAIRRRAAETTRRIVEAAIARARGRREPEIAARLEAALRGGGMEDVFLRFSDGGGLPRPTSDRPVGAAASVVVASEYRGHWVQMSRPLATSLPETRAAYLEALHDGTGVTLHRFELSGPFPFRAIAPDVPLEPGRLFGLHLETRAGLFYGDTCLSESPTAARLL